MSAAARTAVVSVLSNLQELLEEDESLEEALCYAEVVTDGYGQPALISDLYDPNVDGLRGLLSPDMFPADAFCTPPVRLAVIP